MDYAQLIQAGGLAAFAYAVWTELRTQRTEFAAAQKQLHDHLLAIRALLVEIKTLAEGEIHLSRAFDRQWRQGSHDSAEFMVRSPKKPTEED